MEQLSIRPETTQQPSPEEKGWSDFPPFQGNEPAEQNNPVSETIEDAPDYLSDIDPVRRKDISSLQIERDEINEKIFDPDQIQEILDELTNQLDSLANKMKSGDSWQKDQLARNLFTNLEINNKKEVTYRVKKPLESLISGRLTEKSRSGDPGGS